MRQVIKNVYQVEGLFSGQVYVMTESHQVTMIDVGNVMAGRRIKKELGQIGLKVEDVDNVVITHNHMDHVANLNKFCQISGAKVYIHESDYLALSDKMDNNTVVQLKDGDTVPIMGTMTVIHVPGHTPGNMALYSSDYKLLIAGDNVFNERGNAHVPPNFFNNDTAAFAMSYQKLLNFDTEVIATGHGPAITSGGNAIISKLAATLRNK